MSAYSDAVVNDGATTYLRFGETSGTTADDAIGSDDHTYENSPTLGEPSLLAGDTANKAVYWDGTNDRTWCNSPTSALDIGDKFSIEFWVKRTRTSATEYIWSRNWSGCAAVYINSSDKVTLAKTGYGDIASATTSITDTNPHHIVVTKNGSTVKIYIDGSDVTGSISNSTIGSVSGGSGHCWQILVGNYFKGTLDEFAVYKNVELTSLQVTNHYNYGKGNTGASLSGAGTFAATAATSTVTGGAALSGTGRLGYSVYGDPASVIGVCVHPGWTDKTYNDYTNCFADIDEIGTKLLRGGGAYDGNIGQWLSRCKTRGIKMIYGSPGGISSLTTSWLDVLESHMDSYPDVICAVEGLNEPDLNTYGEQQVGETPVEYAARHQEALYGAVKSRFPDLPILAPSIAGNSGWTEPLANKVAGFCTAANCHYYTSGGTADVSLSAVNTAFANARDYAGVAELWVTETGIRSPVTGCTDAEGATRLVGILDAMRHNADAPAVRVCVYQLESPDTVWADENDWALYYYGYTPKAKATALHDYIIAETMVTAQLSGSGTLVSTGTITASSTGAMLYGSGQISAAPSGITTAGPYPNSGLYPSSDLYPGSMDSSESVVIPTTDTPPFGDVIRRSHTVCVQAVVLPDFVELPILDGSVTLDITTPTLASMDLTIADDGTLVPTSPSDLLAPYGREVIIKRGVTHSNGAKELYSLGIFRIEDCDVSDDGGLSLQISGRDRSARLIDATLEDPWSLPTGVLVGTAIIDLLRAGWAGMPYNAADFDAITTTLPALIASEGDDRWDLARGMAEAATRRLYFDETGTLRALPVTTDLTPSMTIAEGKEGALVQVQRQWNRDDVFNRVIVTGEALENSTTARGVWSDEDRGSPTYYDGVSDATGVAFGKVPRAWQSDWVTTDDQAQRVARMILALEGGTTQSLSFDALVDPRLRPDDVVLVVRERLGINETHVIDQLTIPLTGARMTAQTRIRRVTS